MAQNKYEFDILAKDLATRTIKEVQKELKGLDKEVKNSAKEFREGAQAAGLFGAAVATAGALFIKNAIQIASDAEEIGSKFDVVFKGMSEEMNEWAENFASNTGRANQDIKKFSSGIADVLKPMGLQTAAAADMSKKMVELALDVASFNNRQDEDVIRSFTSALTGERESLKTLGIVIQEADVQAEILRQSTEGLTFATEKEAKAQATLSLLYMQTADAQGDLRRTSESFANQLKALDGEWTNLVEEIGKEFLPIAGKVVENMKDTISVIRDLSPEMKALITSVVTLGTGLGAALAVIGAVTFALPKLRAALVAVGIASNFALGPIGLFTAALAGAITLINVFNAARDETISSLGKSEQAWKGLAEGANEADEALIAVANNQEKAFKSEKELREFLKENKGFLTGNDLAIAKSLERRAIASRKIADEYVNDTEAQKQAITSLAETASIAFKGLRGQLFKKPEPTKDEDIDITPTGPAGPKGKSETEKQLEAEQKLIEENIKAIDKLNLNYRDFGLDVFKVLTDLESKHEKTIQKFNDEINELVATLGELQTAFNIQTQGFDKSLAEQFVDQEQTISDLKKQIQEGAKDQRDTTALTKQLAEEENALKNFAETALLLEEEIEEARRIAALTNFEREVENIQRRKELAETEFNERKALIEQQIVDLQLQKEEEERIFNERKEEIEGVIDSYFDLQQGIKSSMDASAEITKIRVGQIIEELQRLQDAFKVAEGFGIRPENLLTTQAIGGGGGGTQTITNTISIIIDGAANPEETAITVKEVLRRELELQLNGSI